MEGTAGKSLTEGAQGSAELQLLLSSWLTLITKLFSVGVEAMRIYLQRKETPVATTSIYCQRATCVQQARVPGFVNIPEHVQACRVPPGAACADRGPTCILETWGVLFEYVSQAGINQPFAL